MPELDKLADKMGQRGIERMVLISDQPMRLFASDGRQATGPAMPMHQLQEVIKEVAPAHLLSQIANEGQFQFPYQASNGLLSVHVGRQNGRLQVDLTPIDKAGNITPSLPLQPPPVPLQVMQPKPNIPVLSQKQKIVSPVIWGIGLVVVLILVWAAITLRNERAREADITYVSSAIESQRPLLNEAKRLETLAGASSLYSIQYLSAAVEKQQRAVNQIEAIKPNTSEGRALLEGTLNKEKNVVLFRWKLRLDNETAMLRGGN